MRLLSLDRFLAPFRNPLIRLPSPCWFPKNDLARASGLAQTGQALQMLISPSLAGILYLSIGLQGVILIDFLTYFFAVAALILIHIPQPPPEETEKKTHVRLGQDAWFGW